MFKKEPKKIPLTDAPRSKQVKKYPLPPLSPNDNIVRPDNDSVYKPIKKD